MVAWDHLPSLTEELTLGRMAAGTGRGKSNRGVAKCSVKRNLAPLCMNLWWIWSLQLWPQWRLLTSALQLLWVTPVDWIFCLVRIWTCRCHFQCLCGPSGFGSMLSTCVWRGKHNTLSTVGCLVVSSGERRLSFF